MHQVAMKADDDVLLLDSRFSTAERHCCDATSFYDAIIAPVCFPSPLPSPSM